MYYGFDGYELYQENPVKIVIDSDGSPLFCGTDVAKLLCYKAPSVAVQNNCKDRKIIPFYSTESPMLSRAAFISGTDVLRLVKSRINNAEQFMVDILNGKTPTITRGKCKKSLAVIDLDRENSVVMYDGYRYAVTVRCC